MVAGCGGGFALSCCVIEGFRQGWWGRGALQESVGFDILSNALSVNGEYRRPKRRIKCPRRILSDRLPVYIRYWPSAS